MNFSCFCFRWEHWLSVKWFRWVENILTVSFQSPVLFPKGSRILKMINVLFYWVFMYFRMKVLKVSSLFGMCLCHILSRFAKMHDFICPSWGHLWCELGPSINVFCRSVCPSIYPSNRPSVHSSIHLSVCPSVCPSIGPSVHHSVRLYICLYICLTLLYFSMSACPFIQLVCTWKVRRNCEISFRFVLFPKGFSIL